MDDDHDCAFWFLDSVDDSPETSRKNEEDDADNNDLRQTNKLFWDQQLKNLEASLYRTSSAESRVRRATKDVIRGVEREYCRCRGKRSTEDCGECLRVAVKEGLEREGFDCAICVSTSSSHTFLEVLLLEENRNNRRVIVELGLRTEFQMAAAGEDYDRLVAKLPEVYVGKAERLREVADIMCEAAKMCMKQKNMHLAPWRRQNYVKAKWLANCHRGRSAMPLPPPLKIPQPIVRPRASLLTFDLSESVPVQRSSVVV